jgi:hypothetical protein
MVTIGIPINSSGSEQGQASTFTLRRASVCSPWAWRQRLGQSEHRGVVAGAFSRVACSAILTLLPLAIVFLKVRRQAQRSHVEAG